VEAELIAPSGKILGVNDIDYVTIKSKINSSKKHLLM
jgi:hypothetical protein